jgi:hypothetical protein
MDRELHYCECKHLCEFAFQGYGHKTYAHLWHQCDIDKAILAEFLLYLSVIQLIHNFIRPANNGTVLLGKILFKKDILPVGYLTKKLEKNVIYQNAPEIWRSYLTIKIILKLY